MLTPFWCDPGSWCFLLAELVLRPRSIMIINNMNLKWISLFLYIKWEFPTLPRRSLLWEMWYTYFSKICGFGDNLLGGSWNISLFYCLLEFPLFETGSDTYISPINGSRCQGTRLLLLALKGLHSGALVQEDSEGGYSAEEILQLAFHNILLRRRIFSWRNIATSIS